MTNVMRVGSQRAGSTYITRYFLSASVWAFLVGLFEKLLLILCVCGCAYEPLSPIVTTANHQLLLVVSLSFLS